MQRAEDSVILDPRVVARAVEAWLAAHRFVASEDEAGGYTGETADAVITSAVGPFTRARAALYRAYESEVHRRATLQLGQRPSALRRPRNQGRKLSSYERTEILERLRAGETPKEIAQAVGRSLPMVYVLRKELAS